MIEILAGYLLALAYGILLVFLGEVWLKKHKSDHDRFFVRKIIHILICGEWFILSARFKNSVHWIIFCGVGIVALLACLKIGLIKSPSNQDGSSKGSIHYALIATLLSSICFFFPVLFPCFGLTMCCLSIGDGLAGVLGKLVFFDKLQLINRKSIPGSFAAFIGSAIVAFVFANKYLMNLSLAEIVCIAYVFSLIELITPSGYDNITTSLATFILSGCFIFFEVSFKFILPVVILTLLAVVVFHKKTLTLAAAVCSLIVALCITISIDINALLMMAVFYVGAMLCDRIKQKKKRIVLYDVHDSHGKRNLIQVLCCAIFPCLSGICFLITKNPSWLCVYSATLAESFGDTAASEIGILSKKVPVDICTFQKIELGLSGGVTLLGYVACVGAAAVISALYLFFYNMNWSGCVIVFVSAMLGVTVDSVLGSLVQRKFVCQVCGVHTERVEHCEAPTKLYRGCRWLRNTEVNLISNGFSFATAAVICFLVNSFS